MEIHDGQEEAVIGLAERLMGLAEAFGCGEEDTWALSEPGEAEKLRLFRHAVPEGINQAVERVSRRDPRIVKMVFDGSCPGIPLGEAAARYRREADNQGVPAAVFGPIRENRLQVNLIPEDHAAYRRAGPLMDRWQAEAGQAGGDPFGVYGIGKLRAEGFRRRLSQEEFRALGALKGAADPGGRLNQGTLWADPEGAG